MPPSKGLLTKAAMTCFICSISFLLFAQSSDTSESSTPDEPSPKAFKIVEPTPEMLKMSSAELFKLIDLDGSLSKKEFAIFQGKEAHLNTFFKRADKNSSGDLDINEASAHIDEEIFPSKKLKNIKKANKPIKP